MEIAELVLSSISTLIAVLSFVCAVSAKKESKEVKKELNFIIENNPDIKVSKTINTKINTSNKIVGDNNIVAGGNIYDKK